MKKNFLITVIFIFVFLCLLTSCEHKHKFGEWTQIQVATCTSDNIEERTCRCGEIEIRSTIKAIGHSYGEWKTTEEVKCTKDGTEQRACLCGNIETRVVKSPGVHESWENGVCKKCSTLWVDILKNHIIENGSVRDNGKYYVICVEFDDGESPLLATEYITELMYNTDTNSIEILCTTTNLGTIGQMELTIPPIQTNSFVYKFHNVRLLASITSTLRGIVDISTLKECKEIDYNTFVQSDNKTNLLLTDRQVAVSRFQCMFDGIDNYLIDEGLGITMSAFGYSVQD